MGPTWGPPGSCRPQVGPMTAPWTLLSGTLPLCPTDPEYKPSHTRCRHYVTCAFINYMEWHDDVIKWKHFPRYWPFVRGIHRSPVNSPHKGQWRGALMFSLVCVWINGWENNREAGDLIRQRSHYDVTVMVSRPTKNPVWGVTRNHSARWWTILVSCPTDPECKT